MVNFDYAESYGWFLSRGNANASHAVYSIAVNKVKSFNGSGVMTVLRGYGMTRIEVLSSYNPITGFPGKHIFFKGKPEETFNMFRDILNEGISNIDKIEVRNEFKLWINIHYFLPSKRFLLTVHTLT